ncbi:hypothetical protein SAMN05421779_104298 [Insolitispirillum peregrinum]|uniref:Antifreeze glycopeptide polyprotein n=2 Tax=Insolitispirillum peregrinum TaxID=80876 RepID=A0A1N7MS44_9PROT|nr:hypothetical protein SAMN05421779_104298 [Insolitispirillum peregrinum]
MRQVGLGWAIRGSLVAGVMVSGVLTGGPAGAQQPLSLVPADQGGVPVAAPAPAPAPVPAPAATPAPTPPPSAPAPEGNRASLFEVKDLRPLTIDGKGLIEPGLAGMPGDIWSDGTPTSRRFAERLIAAQMAQQVPALSDLQRRMLVLNSEPPAQGGGSAAGGKDGSFLEARIRQLLLLGNTEEVRALVDLVPAQSRSEVMILSQVNSLLINGDSESACAIVRQQLEQAASTPWQKAMVYCEYLAGHGDGAAMQTGLLRDQGEAENDPLFFWVAESLSGLQVLPLESLKDPTPLAAVMLRSSGKPLPTGVLVSPPAWLARTLALSGQGAATSKIDPLMRAVAGEQAFQRAALSREALTGLYDKAALAGKLSASPLETLAADPSAAATAALWVRAKAQGSVPDQAQVVAKAWEQANSRALPLLAASLYGPMVQTMPVTPDLGWFAGTAARILLASGAAEQARPWLKLAQSQSNGAQTALLDRLAFNGFSSGLSADALAAWRKAQAGKSEDIARREQRLLTLLQAVGDRLDPGLWADLWATSARDAGQTPSASRWQALIRAAGQKHVGETIGLVMLVADGQPVAALSDGALSLMIDSLRQVGLTADARALAVQAAIASGL